MASRCGTCQGTDLEFHADGSAACRTCGSVTPPLIVSPPGQYQPAAQVAGSPTPPFVAPGYGPGFYPARPATRVNWIAVVGGLIFFFGAAVYALSNSLYVASLEADSYDTYKLAINLDSLAFILFGIGLLVAIVGFAVHRRA